jgi:hypothetical protein
MSDTNRICIKCGINPANVAGRRTCSKCHNQQTIARRRAGLSFSDPTKTAERFSKYVRRVDGEGCWEWTGACISVGYGVFMLNGKLRRAHRVAYELATGKPVPSDLCVCHRCDNRRCVRPDHFFLGTHADNAADRDAKGRSARGDRSGSRLHPERLRHGTDNHFAKLDDDKVRRIRELRRIGLSGPRIGTMFGVCNVTVYEIEHRRTWKHVL